MTGMIIDHPVLVMDSHERKMNVSKGLEHDTWHVYGRWSWTSFPSDGEQPKFEVLNGEGFVG